MHSLGMARDPIPRESIGKLTSEKPISPLPPREQVDDFSAKWLARSLHELSRGIVPATRPT